MYILFIENAYPRLGGFQGSADWFIIIIAKRLITIGCGITIIKATPNE